MYSSGIKSLDEALGPAMAPGKYLLFSAPQGGGKTIMAAQFALHAMRARRDVLMISTEVQWPAFFKRIVAAGCDQPYQTIKDGIKLEDVKGSERRPQVDIYGERFCENFRKQQALCCTFLKFPTVNSLTFTPDDRIQAVLTEYISKSGKPPALVVVDYIR
jgi:hypothetical protein